MISYLITDPSYYSQTPDTFIFRLREVLRHHRVDWVLYRDKESSCYESIAPLFVALCHELGVKPILHNDASLASQLGAFGVHYSSDKLCTIGQKDEGLFRIGSAHSLEQIRGFAALGIDAVTYSPIFDTPNKGAPVGLESLKTILATITLPVIALGGIVTPHHVAQIEDCGAYGFASIRYFFKD
ncbi:MAG: hypothetical protein KU37_09505 [Sulfuricurvum sp. PC08-66]|nr:MAG: hypothetical protein KU37_09505 [Sulfuricurvum sp. PC08-66]